MRLVFSGNDNMLMSVLVSECSSPQLGNSVTRPPHSSLSLLLLKSSPPIDMASCSTNQPLTFSHPILQWVCAIRATLCDRGQCERVSGSVQCCQLQPWTAGGSAARPLQPHHQPHKKTTQFPAFFLKILPWRVTLCHCYGRNPVKGQYPIEWISFPLSQVLVKVNNWRTCLSVFEAGNGLSWRVVCCDVKINFGWRIFFRQIPKLVSFIIVRDEKMRFSRNMSE